MGHERWFRGQHDGRERPFDWRALARQRGIPEPLARALYEQAVRQARGATQVGEIYLGLLTEALPEASRPSPGKVTRTMRLEAERASRDRRSTPPSRAGRQAAAPGKRTLTSYIEPVRDERRVMDAQRAADRLSAQDIPAPDAAPDPRLQAHLAAALGHFEQLDALDQGQIAAEPATTMEMTWQPGEVDRGDTADSPLDELTLPSRWQQAGERQAGERLTDPGRRADDWDVEGLIRAARSQEGTEVPGYLPARGAEGPGIAVHRKAEDSAPPDDDAAERLRAARGDTGTPLPAELSAELAEALGVPHERVASVRVHTGAASAEAADALAARAFTIGPDVHFAAGAYGPTTGSGRRLIAHEVAHAVARPAATLDGGEVRVSEPDDTHERAADRFADTFTTRSGTRGTAAASPPPSPAMVDGLGPAPGATIHRYAAELTEEEERKRREKRRRKDGEPDQATDAGTQDGTRQAEGMAAPPAGELPRAVPGARDVAAQEERSRGHGPLDQAVVAAGGDAPREAAQRARDRGRAASPAGADREQGAGDRKRGAGEDAGDPGEGQEQGAPGAGLDAVKALATLGDRTGGHGGAEHAERGDADLHAEHGGGDHQGAPGNVPGARGDGREAPATAARGGDEIDFAETDLYRLVPPEPDEPPEAYERRIAVARAELAQDRAYAIGRLTEFRAAQGERIAALSALRPQIDQALTGAEQRATEQVSQAAAAQRQAVRAEVARSIQQAQAAAAAARAQIQSSYAATSSAITAATTAARTQITDSYQQSLVATRTAESSQISEVARLYTQAEGAFRAAASAAGSHATSVAGDRARTYRAGRINRDDSFLDGPLTDNRCEARAEAAEEVGKAYRDELVKEGDKQGNEMQRRKPTDEAAVRQVAEEARRNLETACRESLRGLDEGEQRALASARQVSDGALAGTARTLQQTVSGLRGHERAQVASIDQQAQAQKKALRQQRAEAARQLRGTLDRAIADLGAGLAQSIAAIRGAEVPEPEALDQTLAQCSQAIDSRLEQLRAGIAQGREQVVQALGEGAARSARALTQTGSAAIASAQQTGAGAAQSIAQGAQAADASFQEMAAAHQGTTTQSAAAAARGDTAITTGLGQAYARLGQSLQQGMQRNADAVRTGLIEVVDSDMGATITKEADEAAAQVQPRWKSILKWLIIIAIVLVVAIVLGPMVIGAVAGIATGLGASAAVAGVVGAVVGGAIVGAATAAVTTVVDNAFAGRTGWDLFQGVGTAMAWGALGGALGGGASALLAGPMQGMSALARYGIELGIDLVIDTGISLMTGGLSWQDFGTGLLMTLLVDGITSHPRVRSFGSGPGKTTQPGSSRPDVSIAAPKRGDAADGATTPHGPAPDGPAPRAPGDGPASRAPGDGPAPRALGDGPAPDAPTPRPTDAEGAAPRPDATTPRDGDGGAPVGGGVKGKDVYSMTGKSAKDADEFHDKIHDVFPDTPGLLAHGAVKGKGAGKGDHFLDVNGVKVVMDIRMMRKAKFEKATAASVHGVDQGPAMNTIKYEKGVWMAEITVDQRLPFADYEKVLGHEFDEIAGVVAKEDPKIKAGGHGDSEALKKDIEAQQEARVFKKGGSSDAADLTAHDRAAMNELARLANDIGSNRKGDATGSKHHVDFTKNSRELAQEQSLEKMLDSMGITGMSDPRVKVLLGNVGAKLDPSAMRWLTNYLHAREMGGPFTPQVVDHLLQPSSKNAAEPAWRLLGVGGGHDTTALLDMVANAPKVDGNPKFKLEHPPGKKASIDITSSAGTTKVQNWEQYRYFSGRGYVKSGAPKTSVDDSAVHMAYLKEFHDNVLIPAAAAGKLTPTGLNTLYNKDGLKIMVAIKALKPLEITTMYIDASNF